MIAKCVQDYFLNELVNTMLPRDAGGQEEGEGSGEGSSDRSSYSSLPVEVAVSDIESIGFQVGQRIVEGRAKGMRRMKGARDVMKFMCKDFWAFAFGATKVPRLQTNNYDTYVIEDTNFSLLEHVAPVGDVDFDTEVLKFLIYPCGLIRGALSSLGVVCTVNAECTESPKVKFTILCLV